MKKGALVAAVGAIVFSLLVLSTAHLSGPAEATDLGCETTCSGRVDKKPGESFAVRISFKNKGTTKGVWNVTVTFEGNEWVWEGQKKRLALDPGERETLTWEGNTPVDATENSVARLVVYHDGEHEALDWWICVVSGAELAIVDSKVT
jgi:hypothetical protein